MARPNQEQIETLMSITGVSEATAIHKLEEHGGNLNEAVNAHFGEEERSRTHQTSVAAPVDDAMDVDDTFQSESHQPPPSVPYSAGRLNPFSLLDPNFTRSIFDSGSDLTSRQPIVSHPREVREIPIEVKDGTELSGHSGGAPTVEDVTGIVDAQGPEVHGTVTIDDDVDVSTLPLTRAPNRHYRPSAPGIDDLPDYSNDIEEEMIRAAIEASKRDAEIPNNQPSHTNQGVSVPQRGQSVAEDPELAHAVSLSLKTAEQEKALRELEEGKVGLQEVESSKLVEEECKLVSANGRQSRLEVGSSSLQDEAEDVEDQPLVRHSRKQRSSSSIETAKDIEEEVDTPPASPRARNNQVQQDGRDIHSDEWGGISSEEHDEAVMLEAAMFGGIPEGTGYHFPYAPHQFMQNGVDRTIGPYSRPMPRPPSPSLTAQRLLREQQDDEYLASLQADREKELKAKEEAEAALAEERRREEESLRKLEEEQEIERQLAAKEASLPQEPSPDDENAVTLLVRMPDGSRRGRRFLNSHKLQCLFDFIDIGRVVKPGTYRVVSPYPRRAFSDGETSLTFKELGLASKQEALFLELI